MKQSATLAGSDAAARTVPARSGADVLGLARRYGMLIGTPVLVLIVALLLWQYAVQNQELPPPSKILAALGSNRAMILTDMRITFWEEAIRGYVAGCGLGFLAGVLCSRLDWLRRGLIPYAVLSSSIPIIAFSPVMVFWFGFDWPSKAAVVAVLTFFPMLINTATGLLSYHPLSRQLLDSYAASGWTVFTKLQLPAALPMIFNGLKICSTLSVIGATVAEYFSSLGTGLGSQINDGAQAAQWDLVWACVFVSCAVGILFYVALLVLERIFTFWHVSYRSTP
jgi:NitT/TauT family transport system permease protein